MYDLLVNEETEKVMFIIFGCTFGLGLVLAGLLIVTHRSGRRMSLKLRREAELLQAQRCQFTPARLSIYEQSLANAMATPSPGEASVPSKTALRACLK